ncbi:MafI family immunity protein [Novosphingobium sp. PhB55]|uniref:MafI family immunity protein n=1 Tax=Novosphingobium sp. PhB55 TaxID=2485106 RepID=UPI001416F201|nr:MafI family immunity protein [Novosphingobium sp. PhB55]
MVPKLPFRSRQQSGHTVKGDVSRKLGFAANAGLSQCCGANMKLTMDDIIKRVRALGLGFLGRIDSRRIDFALGYIDHNELPLAFDTLCDYICDYSNSITRIEYDEIRSLEIHFGTPVNSRISSIMAGMVFGT